MSIRSPSYKFPGWRGELKWLKVKAEKNEKIQLKMTFSQSIVKLVRIFYRETSVGICVYRCLCWRPNLPWSLLGRIPELHTPKQGQRQNLFRWCRCGFSRHPESIIFGKHLWIHYRGKLPVDTDNINACGNQKWHFRTVGIHQRAKYRCMSFRKALRPVLALFLLLFVHKSIDKSDSRDKTHW